MKRLLIIPFLIFVSFSYGKDGYFKKFDFVTFKPFEKINKSEYDLTKEILFEGGEETYRAFKIEYDKKEIVSIRYSVFTMNKLGANKWKLMIDSSMYELGSIGAVLTLESDVIHSTSIGNGSCCANESSSIINRKTMLQELYVEDYGSNSIDSIKTYYSRINGREVNDTTQSLSNLYSTSKTIKVSKFLNANVTKPYGIYRTEYVKTYFIYSDEVYIYCFLNLLSNEINFVMNDVYINFGGIYEVYFPGKYEKFEFSYVKRVFGKPYTFKKINNSDGEW